METHTDGDTYGYIYTTISSDNSIRVGINKKTKKEWFHPGSIRGPSPRQDDVITNYTMKPYTNKKEKEHNKTQKGRREINKQKVHCGVVGNIQASHVCAPGSIPGDGIFSLKFTGNKENEK